MVSHAADLLLQSEPEEFEYKLHDSMVILGGALEADRISIWRNHKLDGQLHCSQIYEWSNGLKQQSKGFAGAIAYNEKLPGWEEKLSQGNCIDNITRNMSEEEYALLSSWGIVSVFVAPVFLHEQFWGFIKYDDCFKERLASETEQSILLSASRLIANALLKTEMMLSIRSKSLQLEADLEKAHEKSRMKSNFLSSMSHEMRTPLNAIIGLSELSLDNDTLDEETH
ncbi:MAG: GAF domain-containing protein, partial [Treponema sp.]|nr:GAF domain-containing protein [Treponema sp.]